MLHGALAFVCASGPAAVSVAMSVSAVEGALPLSLPTACALAAAAVSAGCVRTRVWQTWA